MRAATWEGEMSGFDIILSLVLALMIVGAFVAVFVIQDRRIVTLEAAFRRLRSDIENRDDLDTEWTYSIVGSEDS